MFLCNVCKKVGKSKKQGGFPVRSFTKAGASLQTRVFFQAPDQKPCNLYPRSFRCLTPTNEKIMQALLIGGGIIGLSAARYLHEAGWNVTVLEKGDGTDNCSFGNMGYLSPSHFVPLAAPGMIEQGFWWMFDQKSPFSVLARLTRALLDLVVYMMT